MAFNLKERLRRLRRRLSGKTDSKPNPPPLAQPQIERGPRVAIAFPPGLGPSTPLSRSRASLPSRLQHNLACAPDPAHPRHSAPPRIAAAANTGGSRLSLPPSGVADRHVPTHVNASRTAVQFWAPAQPRAPRHVPVIQPIAPYAASETGRASPRRTPLAFVTTTGPGAGGGRGLR